jgi:hypothetical protein
MSAVSSQALKQLFGKLDLSEARLKGAITDEYRKVVATIFEDIVKHTPQFSGNLASGWVINFTGNNQASPTTLGVDRRKEMFQAKRFGADVYKRGDDPAVSETLMREVPKLADIRWNSNITIRNTISYADQVEAGEGPNGLPIRPENLYRGQVFMAEYAVMKYSRLRNLVRITSK